MARPAEHYLQQRQQATLFSKSLWAWSCQWSILLIFPQQSCFFCSSIEEPSLFIPFSISSWSMSWSLGLLIQWASSHCLWAVSEILCEWPPHLQSEVPASANVFLQRQVLIPFIFTKPSPTLLCTFLRCSKQNCMQYLRWLWLCKVFIRAKSRPCVLFLHDDFTHFVG